MKVRNTSLTSFAPPVDLVRKRWVSKEVPLDGEVKAQIDFSGHTVGWELTGFGRGK